jgi:hypothetical protein
MLALINMNIDTNSKWFITAVPWALPLHLILPYAFVASGYRGLFWAWETGYAPFWMVFLFLSFFSLISSLFLWKLNDAGVALYKIGYLVALSYTAYFSMMARMHSLLILVFFLFAAGVLLSEKMNRVLKLPYYDARRKWWESYPKGIPGLRVEIVNTGGELLRGRLSNFGEEGCFVFSEEGAVHFAPEILKVYSEDALLLDAKVELIFATADRFGCGLKFKSDTNSGDSGKDLRDYLGYLRRSGYEVV